MPSFTRRARVAPEESKWGNNLANLRNKLKENKTKRNTLRFNLASLRSKLRANIKNRNSKIEIGNGNLWHLMRKRQYNISKEGKYGYFNHENANKKEAARIAEKEQIASGQPFRDARKLEKNKCYEHKYTDEHTYKDVGEFIRSYDEGSGDGRGSTVEFNDNGTLINFPSGKFKGRDVIYSSFKLVPCKEQNTQNNAPLIKDAEAMDQNKSF